MNILVTGGRYYSDANEVNKALIEVTSAALHCAVVHGDASGADTMAKRWCYEQGVPCISVPAQWKKYGKAAGMIRNQWMVDHIKIDLCVAFPGGAGTEGMKKICRARDIPIYEAGQS
jgi:hypothetical protein